MSVYRVTDLIGTSTESWEDAASVHSRRRAGRFAIFGSPRLCRRTFTSRKAARSRIGRSFASRSSTNLGSSRLTGGGAKAARRLLPAQPARRRQAGGEEDGQHDDELVVVPSEAEPGILDEDDDVLERGDVGDRVERVGHDFGWWPGPGDQEHHEPEEDPHSLRRPGARQQRAEEEADGREAQDAHQEATEDAHQRVRRSDVPTQLRGADEHQPAERGCNEGDEYLRAEDAVAGHRRGTEAS